MSGARHLRHVIGCGLFVLLLAVPASTACHSATDTNPAPPAGEAPDYNFGDDFGYRVYFKNQGGDGVLSTNPAVSSDAELAKGGADTGLSTGLATWQGNSDGYTIEFKGAPLEHDLWLNLSKPMFGFVWISSSSLQSAVKRDDLFWRTYVYLGDKYIGGDECMHFSAAQTSATATWIQTKLKMRPEIDKLPAGGVLKVKVIFYGGLSDFRVGTNTPQQSWLEFRVTSYDLAKTALYLENQQLRFGVPEYDTEDEGDDGSSAAGAGLAGLALPMVFLVPRRRRTAALLALIIVSGALAGCVSGKAKQDSSTKKGPQPTISTTSVLDPTLHGVGAIQGRVFTDLGLPVRKAHVVLIGTANFTDTDGKGFFKLKSVQAGQYKLRIDKDKLLPIEQFVRIEVGKLLTVNATMVPPGDLRGNQREHIHGDWGDSLDFPLWSGDVQLKGTDYSMNGEYQLQKAGVGLCYSYQLCTGDFTPSGERTVMPGTGRVEVKVSWSEGSVPMDMVGLDVVTAKGTWKNGATNYYMEKSLMPRKSGETFNIYIFPDEADQGHQEYSKWTFALWAPYTRNLYSAWGPLAQQMPSVHVEMKIHKGVVVREPPHKDFWGNLTEKTILIESKKGAGQVATDHPGTTYWYHNDWKTAIPPGTKEIRGTFRWDGGTVPDSTTVWKLAYKPGNTPYDAGYVSKGGTLKQAEGTVNGKKLEFTIPVASDEADQFYNGNSNWMFFPDDGVDRIEGTTYSTAPGYGVYWYLSLRLIKDPNFVD